MLGLPKRLRRSYVDLSLGDPVVRAADDLTADLDLLAPVLADHEKMNAILEEADKQQRISMGLPP